MAACDDLREQGANSQGREDGGRKREGGRGSFSLKSSDNTSLFILPQQGVCQINFQISIAKILI